MQRDGIAKRRTAGVPSVFLPIGNAVDFWTEASLFSAAGMTAIVYGPGDIAQAHTADEYVMLDQLRRYADSITRILGNA